MANTIEKTMEEIFDRKRSMIEEVKRQIDLFERHLFSKCILLLGFPPPPSILQLSNGTPFSTLLNCFNNSDAKKEGLLPLHSNKGIKGDNTFSVVSQLCKSEARCGLDVVAEHEHDVSVTSPPYDCGEGGIVSDTCVEHAQSLMRIQRSKSRQRALEIRNSGKPSQARSCDGITGSGIVSLYIDNVDCSELVRYGR